MKVRTKYRFSELFLSFNGYESYSEKQRIIILCDKAQDMPERLTTKEAFQVSYMLERLQNYSFEIGNQEGVLFIEDLRHEISSRLS